MPDAVLWNSSYQNEHDNGDEKGAWGEHLSKQWGLKDPAKNANTCWATVKEKLKIDLRWGNKMKKLSTDDCAILKQKLAKKHMSMADLRLEEEGNRQGSSDNRKEESRSEGEKAAECPVSKAVS